MYSDFSLQCDNLALIRGERLLFKQLSLSLSNGQAIQIRGANGSGKTSFLRVICGILEADQGTVEWRNELLVDNRDDFYANLVYLGHQLGVKQRLTVAENLLFYTSLRKATLCSQSAPLIPFEDAIEKVGLKGFANEFAAHLSQGQTRRVSLARLLLEPAAVWILDEPFVALDVAGQQWLSQEIEHHVTQGGSVIFTSHQPVTLNVPVTTVDIEKPENAYV